MEVTPDLELVCFRGLPGAGKTELAQLLTSYHVAADDFRTDSQGEYHHDIKKHAVAHSKCKQQVEAWMQEQYTPIAVHNTFARLWELKEYFKLGQQYGYRVHIVTVEGWHCTPDQHQVGKSRKRLIAERYQLADHELHKALKSR